MQPAARRANENARNTLRIPISEVSPNPCQSRQALDAGALKALAISIRHLGLLQPIAVRAIAPCRYELVAGRRRLEACQQLGFTHIEAMLVPGGELDAAAAPRCLLSALMESLQREDLHYLEEAEGYASVLEGTCMTQEALAARVGRSQGAIVGKLKLLRLDKPVREKLFQAGLSERHARLLLRLPDATLQAVAIKQMAQGRLTVKESEALIAGLLKEPKEQRALQEPEEPKAPGGLEAAANHLEPAPPARRVISLVRDQRLYINAIGDIIRQMREAGVPAEMEVTEEEACLQINVRISKKNG